MKRQIWLESHEVETVAQALESHATASERLTDYVIVRTGRRELLRIAKRFRNLLAPKQEKQNV